MKDINSLNFRLLHEIEFLRADVIDIFTKGGVSVPNPKLAKIQIAEDVDKKIVGLYVMQPAFHAEPMWIHEEYRDTLLCIRLGKELLKVYAGIKGLIIYAFAPEDNAGGFLRRLGFDKLNYIVYQKEIK